MIKNKFKSILLIIFSILLVMLPNCSNASQITSIPQYSESDLNDNDLDITEYTQLDSGNLDYSITNYKIDMVINNNNDIDIIETITVNFHTNTPEFIRKITVDDSIKTPFAGIEYNYFAKITDIEVTDNFTTYSEDRYKVIKIGDENESLKGKKTYKIKYNYNIFKNFEGFYLNLIGNEWGTRIDDISFKITMPKEIDSSDVRFLIGETDSMSSSPDIDYKVYGNIITGKIDRTLEYGEKLAIKLNLPEGYFINLNTKEDNNYANRIVIFSIACVIVAYILWRTYGKDDKVVETVEVYPPDGLDSAEVGLLYEGSSSLKGVVSLLIELASKGYLKIEQFGEPDFTKQKDSFRIFKLKEYDGNNENEKNFFNGLFKSGRTFVAEYELYDKFYRTLEEIQYELNSKLSKFKIFDKTASKIKILLVMMMITIFILITIKPILNSNMDNGPLMFAIAFPLIAFIIVDNWVFNTPKGIVRDRRSGIPITDPLAKNFSILVWASLFGGGTWSVLILPILLQNKRYILTYAIGLICIVILAIIKKYMDKRTTHGNEILGRIRGFKRFLETAEKEELEKMLYQNPNYFFDMLPYAYSLDVLSKWISRFETINIKAPNWYESNNSFSINSFKDDIAITMFAVTDALAKCPGRSS